jgi:hypothetical protein
LTGRRGPVQEKDAVSGACTPESDSPGVVVDLTAASMAVGESNCTRAQILNGRLCVTRVAIIIEFYSAASIRVYNAAAGRVHSSCTIVEYQYPLRPYGHTLRT